MTRVCYDFKPSNIAAYTNEAIFRDSVSTVIKATRFLNHIPSPLSLADASPF